VRQIIKNDRAGKDFMKGSLIFKCIEIDPSKRTANIDAEGWVNSGTHIATKSPIAPIIFIKPMTW